MPPTLEQAQALVAAAHAHARERGWRVAVAVVDEGGLLVALGRMDGAQPLASQLAEAKAVGAALWHKDGAQLEGLQQQRPAFFAAVGALMRLPPVPGEGSLLLRDGGRVLGAVGISGALSPEDRECGEVAIAQVFGG